MSESAGQPPPVPPLFDEVYHGMPRGGPGDPASTRRALAMMAGLPAGPLVHGTCADMRALPFPHATFDLVWSEGALYSIGFTEGLRVSAEVVNPGAAGPRRVGVAPTAARLMVSAGQPRVDIVSL